MSSLLKIKDFDNLEKTPNYQREWDTYRLLNRNSWTIQIGISVLVLLFYFTDVFNLLHKSEFYFITLLGILFLPSFYYGKKLQNWKCPKCKNNFHSKGIFSTWAWTKYCMHCNLPKYEGSIFKK